MLQNESTMEKRWIKTFSQQMKRFFSRVNSGEKLINYSVFWTSFGFVCLLRNDVGFVVKSVKKMIKCLMNVWVKSVVN
jgi:hypothetical protein